MIIPINEKLNVFINKLSANIKSYKNPDTKQTKKKLIFFLQKYGYIITKDVIRKSGINKLLSDTIFENIASSNKEITSTKYFIIL